MYICNKYEKVSYRRPRLPKVAKKERDGFNQKAACDSVAIGWNWTSR